MRDKLLLIGGGIQVTDELAKEWGMDAGFGRGTKGRDVASHRAGAAGAQRLRTDGQEPVFEAHRHRA